MGTTIFIETSMTIGSERGSISTEGLNIFKNTYQKQLPNEEIICLNLNDLKMAQKTLNCHNYSTFFNKEDSDTYIEQLRSANKIVLAAPMTNFNYPAVLKNYLDHVLVAKKTFLYKYDGLGTSEGLLPHLKVQIITSQGAHLGWYPFGNHTATLQGTWEFMGAKVVKPIIIDGTKAPENLQRPAKEMIEDFRSVIEKAAIEFAKL